MKLMAHLPFSIPSRLCEKVLLMVSLVISPNGNSADLEHAQKERFRKYCPESEENKRHVNFFM